MHNKGENRNSLVVQWLGLGAFTAGGTGSIPGHRTQNLQVVGQKKKKQREPPLTLNMQKSPRVGCEPSVFWALATRRSLWLHHRCSQVLLGPCRLTPTWQESFHLHHLPLLLVCLSGLSSFPDIKLSFRWVSSPPVADFIWAPRDLSVTLVLMQPVAPLSPSRPEPSLPSPSSAPASVTSHTASLSALGR